MRVPRPVSHALVREEALVEGGIGTLETTLTWGEYIN